MDSAYFDSSVFLAIFNGEPSAVNVKALIRELNKSNSRICTSILTVQEVSVASYLFGGDQADNYAKVDRFARIHGVTKDIVLAAAKLEASIIERMQRSGTREKKEMKPRRKLDCLHIATAIEMQCRWIYSFDPGMLKCKELVKPSASITFAEPMPTNPELFGGDRGLRIQ
jgi:predicted nucleic acid-binding protein